ncbi:MAG: hypothetical protein EZS28_043038, partial [Streblomastix strix]
GSKSSTGSSGQTSSKQTDSTQDK